MPKSALPPDFPETAAGTGTDWDNPIQGWIKKSWFAYGPRAKEWWARWREFPFTILALFGKGYSRWETSGGELAVKSVPSPVLLFQPTTVYLSAIQYWCKWSFQIQWPFFVAFHVYLSDVGPNRKMIYVRFGARRDADKVYWFPSLFVGGTWN